MQVKTTEGIVEGEEVSNDICGTYYSFKGIPYAAPPVGDLRFKAPQPPLSYEGVLETKNHGNICPQYNFISKTTEIGNEDCLFLNIYTPDTKPTHLLPVMIWIHGGQFSYGSGNDDIYGPEFLIKHKVILVTFNYRLGVFGFLCLDTENVPGNAGMKDQVAAMRWVNKNIANFGGDPDNVTIFGQGSGGICVTYHCLSPMTKGLFKRAIAQSDCANNWTAQSFRHRDRAVVLANTLGCTSEDNEDLYEFFKNQPAEALINSQVPITFAEMETDKYEAHFLVVNEKVFPNVETYFTGTVNNALKTDIHEGVELIIGYNEDEGTIYFGIHNDMMKTIYQADEYNEYFVFGHFKWHCSTIDQLQIGHEMREFYLNDGNLSIRNMDALVRFYGDMHKFGMLQFAKYFSVKNRVYFYKFTCQSKRNLFSKIVGATRHFKNRQVTGHGDEIPYLFPVKSITENVSKESPTYRHRYRMIQNVSRIWTNFAKTGNPMPNGTPQATWNQYLAEAPSYLEIGHRLVNVTETSVLDKDEYDFWERIFMKYLPNYVYRKSNA